MYSNLPRKGDFIRPYEYHKVLPLIFRLSIESEAASYFFRPRAVYIGPYHHGKSCLAQMEKHKSRFLEDFLSRDTSTSLEDYRNEVKKRWKQSLMNDYYDLAEFDLTRDELVDIMIMDGCFILELLIKTYNQTADEIFENEKLLRYIKTDLLMFENQVPLFVLEMLYKDAIPTIEELLGYYFWGTKDDPSMYEKKSLDPAGSLLQSYNQLYIFPRSDEGKPKHVYPQGIYGEIYTKNRPWLLGRCSTSFAGHVPSAQHLEEAGVVFKAKRSANFLDITFHEGVLEIPVLSIDEPFLLSFVNLVMFDFHVNCGSVMESYCHFMACLMYTRDDVAILQKHGILEGKFINDLDWWWLSHYFGRPFYNLPVGHYFAYLFDELWLFWALPKAPFG
ncbi:hypothetical protein LUZ62_060636 [Rhynchospora pubera]|uniref:Uncharacterized protein n=1 Tax=Rhynchospora pubera TaxID=906938 RepID=A0AAV8EAN0_9POAL|nr:hypothetical protein LUZ62_060636 [Rhynchospora pubera]